MRFHRQFYVSLVLLLIFFFLVFLSVKFLRASIDSKQHVSVPGVKGAWKSSAPVRAGRRAYEGAPPVIPHRQFGAACTSCHTPEGIAVPGEGFAPPSPHEKTQAMSQTNRCEQCHVFVNTQGLFAENGFDGLVQDLRSGSRLNPFAPPVIPHGLFMRENCLACHSGPAAREEIRTSHPERWRCLQCHAEKIDTGEFSQWKF